MRVTRALGTAIAIGALCAGCGATVVRSGLPAGRTDEAFDERWHHGFFVGLVDASGPYDLASICPMGWSEFRVEGSAVKSLLELLTVGIYSPSTVTIVCAETAADPPAPPGEGPLPPAPRGVP